MCFPNPMLLFHPIKKKRFADVRRNGLHARNGAPLLLWKTLRAASKATPAAGVVLVIESSGVADLQEMQGKSGFTTTALSPKTILNLNPYLPARPIEAGGGYVTRPGLTEPDLLMIFRRGVWDLPKGKLDKGETPEAGALREVREEVGIESLELVGSLGATVHGYPERGKYRVKTTYWFQMHTPETKFTPQLDEGIEQVAWMPWSEAKRRIGYHTLRQHMTEIEQKNLLISDG